MVGAPQDDVSQLPDAYQPDDDETDLGKPIGPASTGRKGPTGWKIYSIEPRSDATDGYEAVMDFSCRALRSSFMARPMKLISSP